MLAQRRRLEAFDDQQEEDLLEILAAFAANLVLLSTMQLQSVWVRSRSQAFIFKRPSASSYTGP